MIVVQRQCLLLSYIDNMKPYQIFLLLTWMAVSVSCKQNFQTTDECKTYFQTVKEDWKYNVEKRVYKVEAQNGRKNVDFIHKLLYDKKTCWEGLPAKHVRKLFGKPSAVEGYVWRYFIMESCWDEKVVNCQDFLMTVHPEKGLIGIELGAFTIEP